MAVPHSSWVNLANLARGRLAGKKTVDLAARQWIASLVPGRARVSEDYGSWRVIHQKIVSQRLL
ncbi:MAG TPA: hypothetical protein VFQ60_03510, partial [Patescibacteria group bacterium]|nr:hypothetical protein [Patescibacteria group bacterium]